MYKKTQANKTGLTVNNSVQGQSIEDKVMKLIDNKEPIKDNAPLIYQERKDGVQPAYDIRTDKMEIAVEAMTKVATTHTGERNKRLGEEAKKNMEKEIKTENKKIDKEGMTPSDSTDSPK